MANNFVSIFELCFVTQIHNNIVNLSDSIVLALSLFYMVKKGLF